MLRIIQIKLNTTLVYCMLHKYYYIYLKTVLINKIMRFLYTKMFGVYVDGYTHLQAYICMYIQAQHATAYITAK